jgi:RHS repeat-associated protein
VQPSNYSFNGKEKDDEVYGDGNFQDYGMRIYDARLGRPLSIDPLSNKFADLSTYQFFSNSPIANVDLDGCEKIFYMGVFQSKEGKTFVTALNSTKTYQNAIKAFQSQSAKNGLVIEGTTSVVEGRSATGTHFYLPSEALKNIYKIDKREDQVTALYNYINKTYGEVFTKEEIDNGVLDPALMSGSEGKGLEIALAERGYAKEALKPTTKQNKLFRAINIRLLGQTVFHEIFAHFLGKGHAGLFVPRDSQGNPDPQKNEEYQKKEGKGEYSEEPDPASVGGKFDEEFTIEIDKAESQKKPIKP